jgi:hypothetical protein
VGVRSHRLGQYALNSHPLRMNDQVHFSETNYSQRWYHFRTAKSPTYWSFGALWHLLRRSQSFSSGLSIYTIRACCTSNHNTCRTMQSPSLSSDHFVSAIVFISELTGAVEALGYTCITWEPSTNVHTASDPSRGLEHMSYSTSGVMLTFVTVACAGCQVNCQNAATGHSTCYVEQPTVH